LAPFRGLLDLLGFRESGGGRATGRAVVLAVFENGGGKIFFGDLGLDPPDAAASLVEPKDDETAQDERQKSEHAEQNDQKSFHGSTLSFPTISINTIGIITAIN
jgi:hypothetical protein